MSNRHKTFISYHHANDQLYKNKLVHMLGANYIIDKSVNDGDIEDQNIKVETIRQKIRDNYIADATVLLVLIGSQTWQRKHVDWEISSGLRHTKHNDRCGLIGILLPTHPSYDENTYDPNIIPPRLYDNLKAGFAKLYDWSSDPQKVQDWIHWAFDRRFKIDPDNSRSPFVNNRTGGRWQD